MPAEPTTQATNEDDYLYHIAEEAEWTEAKTKGDYWGGALCRQDGFIHLSTQDQMLSTWAVHYAPRTEGLVVLRLQKVDLGPALRFEVSRGGARFPHLYRSLVPTECEVLGLTEIRGFDAIAEKTGKTETSNAAPDTTAASINESKKRTQP